MCERTKCSFNESSGGYKHGLEHKFKEENPQEDSKCAKDKVFCKDPRGGSDEDTTWIQTQNPQLIQQYGCLYEHQV